MLRAVGSDRAEQVCCIWKTKELRGMLFRVAAHCRIEEARRGRCVHGCVRVLVLVKGGDTVFWFSGRPNMNGTHKKFAPQERD